MSRDNPPPPSPSKKPPAGWPNNHHPCAQHRTTSTSGIANALFSNHSNDSRMIEERIVVSETARVVIPPIMSTHPVGYSSLTWVLARPGTQCRVPLRISYDLKVSHDCGSLGHLLPRYPGTAECHENNDEIPLHSATFVSFQHSTYCLIGPQASTEAQEEQAIALLTILSPTLR